MKFLVIGASGFLGKHVFANAKSSGHEVVGTQSRDTSSDFLKFNLLDDRIAECIDPSFFKSGDPVYAVICASISSTDRCKKELESSRKINVEGTLKLIRDLEALKVKPVFVSSSAVYDGKEGGYSEDRPPCPISEYGLHKALVEAYIADHVPNALVMRLDRIMGDEPFEGRNLFSQWYQRAREGAAITCIEGHIFSPTSVDNLAEASILACRMNLSGLYNVSNTELFSQEQLATELVRLLGIDADVVNQPLENFNFLEPRLLKSYIDSSKFLKETGFRFTPIQQVMEMFARKAPVEMRMGS